MAVPPRFLLALALPTAVACEGTLGPSFSPSDGPPGATAQPDPGNFVGGQVNALACENRALRPGAMPGLVRLTHRQYDNAVRDLFGVSANATSEFVSDQEFYGFDNNAEKLSVPANQVSRYQVTAEQVAAQLDAATFAKAVPCLSGAHTDACRDDVLRNGLKLLLRRPLTDAEGARYRALFAAGNDLYDEGDAFSRGVRVVVEAALQSPAFLYRAELRDTPLDGRVIELDDYELAARLALTLWSSIPDATLMAKADDGSLHQDATLTAEVRRMLDDPRSARTLDDFHSQWLEFSKLRFDKDATAFPDYDKASFEASAKREALTFARSVTQQGGTVGDLFSAPYSFLDATLAGVYGVPAPANAFDRVELDASKRAGLFTQLAFLAGHADALDGSPIHRGAYVQRRVLCREFGALPANVGVLPARSGDIVTTRDQVEAKTAAPACQLCHQDINPVGFAFESFDALGRSRTQDHGELVNTTGSLLLDERVSIDGPVQLAAELADSDKARRCYETQWFRYVFARKEAGDDACHLTEVDRTSSNLEDMLLALATSRAFRFRAQEDQ